MSFRQDGPASSGFIRARRHHNEPLNDAAAGTRLLASVLNHKARLPDSFAC